MLELFTWKIPHFSDFVFIPTKKKNLSLSEAFWISSLLIMMVNYSLVSLLVSRTLVFS
jgi:hypothetical protein